MCWGVMPVMLMASCPALKLPALERISGLAVSLLRMETASPPCFAVSELAPTAPRMDRPVWAVSDLLIWMPPAADVVPLDQVLPLVIKPLVGVQPDPLHP